MTKQNPQIDTPGVRVRALFLVSVTRRACTSIELPSGSGGAGDGAGADAAGDGAVGGGADAGADAGAAAGDSADGADAGGISLPSMPCAEPMATRARAITFAGNFE